MFGLQLDIDPGATATIVLHLKEPAGTGPLVSRMQPMVTPVTFTSTDQSCG